jgi:hypothetical protein
LIKKDGIPGKQPAGNPGDPDLPAPFSCDFWTRTAFNMDIETTGLILWIVLPESLTISRASVGVGVVELFKKIEKY